MSTSVGMWGPKVTFSSPEDRADFREAVRETALTPEDVRGAHWNLRQADAFDSPGVITQDEYELFKSTASDQGLAPADPRLFSAVARRADGLKMVADIRDGVTDSGRIARLPLFEQTSDRHALSEMAEEFVGADRHQAIHTLVHALKRYDLSEPKGTISAAEFKSFEADLEKISNQVRTPDEGIAAMWRLAPGPARDQALQELDRRIGESS